MKIINIKKITAGLVLLILLLVLTTGVNAENACIGATQNFSCGDTITESCTLNGSMQCSGNGLIISSDNITINGDNYNLTGSGGSSAILPDAQRSNITIKNFIITNFFSGIITTDAGWSIGITKSIIQNNTIHDTAYCGISIYGNSYNNSIINNEVYNTGLDGIDISYNGQHNNLIKNNICRNNGHSGIGLYGVWNNTIMNNTIYENGLHGVGLWYVNSDNNKILNNNIYNNSLSGIYFDNNSDNNEINNNTICGNNIDINISGDGNFGDNNTCDVTRNYNDNSSAAGCVNNCSFSLKQDDEFCAKNSECKSGKCVNSTCKSASTNITIGLIIKFPDNETITTCVEVPKYSNGKEILDAAGIQINGTTGADYGFFMNCINDTCSPADWSWYWSFNLIKKNETNRTSMPVGTGPGGDLNDFCWDRNYSAYDGHYCAENGDIIGFGATNAGIIDINLSGICLKQDNEFCTKNSECKSGKCVNGTCRSPSKNITVGLVIKFPNNETITKCVQVPEYANGKDIFEVSGLNFNGSMNSQWGYSLKCVNGTCSPADWTLWYWNFNLIKENGTNWTSMPVGTGPGGTLNDFCWDRKYTGTGGGHYCAEDGDVFGYRASNTIRENYNLNKICLKSDNEFCSMNSECQSGKCMNNICVSRAKNITVGLVIRFPNNETITDCVEVPEYANGKEIFEKSGINFTGTLHSWGYAPECINGTCRPAWGTSSSWWWSFNMIHNNSWSYMPVTMGPSGEPSNDFCRDKGNFSGTCTGSETGDYCAQDGEILGFNATTGGGVMPVYTLSEICNISEPPKQDGESCSKNQECQSGKCMNNICISPSKNITIGLVIKFLDNSTFTTYVKIPEYSNGKEILDAANISYNYTNSSFGFSPVCINGTCRPSDWSWYWSFNLHKNYETEWHSMGIGMGPGGESNNFCWNGDYSKFEGHYCAVDGDVLGIGNGYGIVPEFYTLKQIHPDITIYFCDDDNDSYFDRNVDGTCDTINCTPAGCRETEGNDCNDNDNSIHPDANETCNGNDDNCNNIIDEGGVCGCGCESNTKTTTVFVCGNTITESCTMNCDLNCSGDGFIIGNDNITIDGNGYSLTGSGTGDGIIPTGARNNIVLKNFNSINNFDDGIIAWGTMGNGGTLTNSIIRNNNAHNNDNGGISIYYSSNNQIINNNCYDNGLDGITLYVSNHNTVKDNTCYDNAWNGKRAGIAVLHSGDNIINNNIIYGNEWYGIRVLWDNADNNKISNNKIHDNKETGILFDGGTDNNLVKNNLIINNGGYGISIEYYSTILPANNNKINSNTICNNTEEDINVVAGIGTTGDNNICNTATGYNDTGVTGTNGTSCTYSCSGCVDRDNDDYNYSFTGGGTCGTCDCDDNNSMINPGVAEICTNGIDDDCDTYADCCDSDCECPMGKTCNMTDCSCCTIPVVPELQEPEHKSLPRHKSRSSCSDNDGDGYNGTANCPAGTDCDDSNSSIHPGAKEIYCNGVDEDCDGIDPCTGLKVGENCTDNFNCENGICSGGICIECESDNNCKLHEYCSLGSCLNKKEIGLACDENYECIPGKCVNNKCIVCELSNDCMSNEYCNDGICKELKKLGAACEQNEECLAGRCKNGKCACVRDLDCTGGVCDDGICKEKFVEDAKLTGAAKTPNTAVSNASKEKEAADIQQQASGFWSPLKTSPGFLIIILIITILIIILIFLKRK